MNPGTPPNLAAALAAAAKELATKMDKVQQTHLTIVLFEGIASKLLVHYDHVHCYSWFSATNLALKGPPNYAVYKEVSNEVALDRHPGKAANYLYADGHVDGITVRANRHLVQRRIQLRASVQVNDCSVRNLEFLFKAHRCNVTRRSRVRGYRENAPLFT